jgi:hypothetical protein
MIGHIYYFIGLFILIFSFSNLFNFFKFSKIRDWYIAFEKVTKKTIARKDFRNDKDYNIFILWSVFNFFELTWIVLGLATKSWPIFLSLIIFELLTKLISKNLKFRFISKTFGFSFQMCKFIIILILILNHFHFHQDLLNFLR